MGVGSVVVESFLFDIVSFGIVVAGAPGSGLMMIDEGFEEEEAGRCMVRSKVAEAERVCDFGEGEE